MTGVPIADVGTYVLTVRQVFLGQGAATLTFSVGPAVANCEIGFQMGQHVVVAFENALNIGKGNTWAWEIADDGSVRPFDINTVTNAPSSWDAFWVMLGPGRAPETPSATGSPGSAATVPGGRNGADYSWLVLVGILVLSAAVGAAAATGRFERLANLVRRRVVRPGSQG